VSQELQSRTLIKPASYCSDKENRMTPFQRAFWLAGLVSSLLFAGPATYGNPASSDPAAMLDRSGAPQTGKASYYGPQFAGRPMADGSPFEPESNFAASRTLPLGTKARVTNLENGKSAVVVIRDRGPYVDGRIIDLSPRTARMLDMKEQGVVAVEVTPLELPPSGKSLARQAN
jgi:rare lipoprotein A